MALSGSLVIANSTGANLLISEVDTVNDDATLTVVPPTLHILKRGRNTSISMSKPSVLALPALLGLLSFAQADDTMIGTVAVPKTISGITPSLACHDLLIGAFDVPSCPGSAPHLAVA